MPSSFRAATWSCISAISGDTTTAQPSRSSAGIWKHSDLPPPVGISTSASPPATSGVDDGRLLAAERGVAEDAVEQA